MLHISLALNFLGHSMQHRPVCSLLRPNLQQGSEHEQSYNTSYSVSNSRHQPPEREAEDACQTCFGQNLELTAMPHVSRKTHALNCLMSTLLKVFFKHSAVLKSHCYSQFRSHTVIVKLFHMHVTPFFGQNWSASPS